MNETLIRALESGKPYDSAIGEATAPMRATVRRYLERLPFIPFRLTMTGGSVHEIRHPERVELGSSTLKINAPDPASTTSLNWRCTLALIHVVSLELLNADEPAIVRAATPELTHRKEKVEELS